jgi:hypothetical protein
MKNETKKDVQIFKKVMIRIIKNFIATYNGSMQFK